MLQPWPDAQRFMLLLSVTEFVNLIKPGPKNEAVLSLALSPERVEGMGGGGGVMQGPTVTGPPNTIPAPAARVVMTEQLIVMAPGPPRVSMPAPTSTVPV